LAHFELVSCAFETIQHPVQHLDLALVRAQDRPHNLDQHAADLLAASLAF